MIKGKKIYQNFLLTNYRNDKATKKQERYDNNVSITKCSKSSSLIKTNNSKETKKKLLQVKKEKNVINSNNSKDIQNNKYNNNMYIEQKINNFESRISSLFNVIQNFEDKFIKSPESEKIKEQFNDIINKKIYSKSYTKLSNISTNDNNKEIKGNNIILKDNNYIYDINNINININNNNYGFFISSPMGQSNQRQTDIYNNETKIEEIKTHKKKIKKKNSNVKDSSICKSKIFHLPLDSINNNNNYKNIYENKNKGIINSNKQIEIQMFLTDRKENDIELNQILKSVDNKKMLKSASNKNYKVINNNCENNKKKIICRNNDNEYFKGPKKNKEKYKTIVINCKINNEKDKQKIQKRKSINNNSFIQNILKKRNIIKSK